MSASRKKMLRREENQAALTERQQQEMKESKKLRVYTAIFAVVMIAIIGFVLVSGVLSSGIIERNTTALTVNDEKVSTVTLNYYYIDAINKFMNQYGSYASAMGLDTSLTLGEQTFDENEGTTWADYFLNAAADNAKQIYALNQEAEANGFTLPQEAQDAIDSTIKTLDTYGVASGRTNASGYLKAVYGAGSNKKTYTEYLTAQYVAEYYYNEKTESTTFTDEEIQAADEAAPQSYSSFSYNSYYLSASRFYEGGTTDDEGNTTYSDEEKAAGAEACKAAAESLLSCTTVEELDAAIAALEINAEATSAASTAYTDRAYSKVDTTIRDWVSDADRKAGDIEAIAYTVTTTAEHEHTEEEHEHEEITTVNGYYVVLFNGVNDNAFSLVNVRHILVPFEGGTTDSNGTTTYSDEEKAAAQAKAQDLLDGFLAGEATEEAFATLANENSTDTGSNTNGGLYEDVYPGQMVTNFNDWCFDDSRIAGDTGIVESSYGYHVMYFSGYSDTTYRHYLIDSALRTEAISNWETELIENAAMELVNTNKVNKDLKVNSAS